MTRQSRSWVVAVLGILGCAQVCTSQVPPVAKRRVLIHDSYTRSPTDSLEWTVFVPSVDSRVIYVSTTDGNDANSGLSPAQPKRTIAAAYQLVRDGFPDWVLLKRGNVWSESFQDWQKGGRGANEMMVIGSYGVGARPVLNTGSGKGFFSDANAAPRAHLALTDMCFLSDRPGATSPESGITFLNQWSDVLIENCKVEGYASNIVIQEAPLRPANIRVRRCVVVDAHLADAAHSQGIFAGGIDGLLIEECVFDYNGWRRGVPGAQADIFNHNMYLHESGTNFVTRGNISARGSATGILQRSGGTCENNLLLMNPTGVFLGISEVAGSVTRNALRNNVVLDARDIDSDTPRGLGIWLGGTRHTEVYGNIVAHQRTGSQNVNAFNLESSLLSVAVYRNIVYDWTGAPDINGLAVALDMSDARGVQITDNQFQQVNGGFLVELSGQAGADLGSIFGRNHYFTSNAPPHQFYYATDYPLWVQTSDEPWSSFGRTAFPDPNRTIETYMASLGLTPTIDEFLARTRLQERTSWDTRFTAAAVNAYIQQGFGVAARQCRADFNEDGQVNILDLFAFQTAFSLGDPRADVNLDGVLNSADFVIFQNTVVAGCP